MVQTNVKPLKWREMFICYLWAPYPTWISGWQGKRRSFPGQHGQLTCIQLSQGGLFGALHSRERWKQTMRNFSLITGWHDFNFCFSLLSGCTKITDVILMLSWSRGISFCPGHRGSRFFCLPLYLCVNGPFLAWAGVESMSRGPVYHAESQQREVWANSLELREFIAKKLCDSNT